MYNINDLFDRREAVGSKLEDILLKQELTKAKFCAGAGISRPTLDKLLAGNITSKANFARHMEKVLLRLSMTPDMLMGNIQHPYMKAKSLRSALRLQADDIQKATGIPPERLREIESGADTTMAELRDLALCLGTSMKSILGENIFSPQIATLDDIIQQSDQEDADAASGFWGHIGIMPTHSEEYLWYPITASTRGLVYRMQDKERMVVPCMDNKILYINKRNVNSIILLDDACDTPDFANWDSAVDCGGTPQVIYESLADYFYYTDGESTPDSEEFSPNFIMVLENIKKNRGWNEDMCSELVNTISIHYNNGKVDKTSIQFDEFETISSEIEIIYNFEESFSEEKFLVYTDSNGAEIMVNTDNVSVIELPFAETEAAICHNMEETMDGED